MLRYPVIQLLAIFAFGIAAPAMAADKTEQARIQFQQGIELYEAERYEQASIAFARAYEFKPSYKILFNIAQAENELGHFAGALEAYIRYLVDGADAVKSERRDQVKAEIKRLNALVGSIIVECPVEGATVMVDSEVVGTSPLPGPVFVDLGRHEVEVTRKGDSLHRQIVKVAGGQRVSVSVEIGSRHGDGLPAEEPVEEPSVGDHPADGSDGDGLSPVPFWVFVGVTGAAGIATGAFEIAVQGAIEDVEGDPTNQGAVDRGKSLQTGERVLLAVTAAATVTAVVLFFLTDFGDESEGGAETSVSLVPVITGSGAGIGLGGRF
jgi:PEGA domain